MGMRVTLPTELSIVTRVFCPLLFHLRTFSLDDHV